MVPIVFVQYFGLLRATSKPTKLHLKFVTRIVTPNTDCGEQGVPVAPSGETSKLNFPLLRNMSQTSIVRHSMCLESPTNTHENTVNIGKCVKRSPTMKIIEPKVELINAPDYATLLSTVEQAGRTCYKSEDKITDGSAEKFVRNILKRGHEAVIEHASLTVRFTCDRGVSHEIVRHRLAAYCQESTRYCNYSKDGFGNEITVIKPCFWDEDSNEMCEWRSAMRFAESHYLSLLRFGATPQEARSVLPNSLKTEVVMTADMREWRHFIRLRCAPAAHPDMRVVARLLYDLLKSTYPVFFEDIEVG